MADNGTSVGVINLGLTVVDTLQQQLASIASRAKKQAGSSFSVVGDAAAKAITAPLDAAVKEAQEAAADAAKPIGKIGEAAAEAITKPVNAAIQAAKEAVKHYDGALFPPEKGGKRYHLATHDIPQTAAKPPPQKPDVDAERDIFKVSVDSAGLLQQKLDLINANIDSQKEKLQSVAELWAKAVQESGEGSSEAVKYAVSLDTIKGKLISLQQSANQTGEKIKKSLEEPPKKAKPKFSSLGKTVKSVAAGMKKSLSGAVKSVPSKAGKAVSGVTKQVKGLAKSVKSAFKSAFLMAGLYAAFRGIKSLIGDTVGQNKEFSDSLNLIKSNLLVAFTPIMQVIQPALNALASGFAAVSQQIAAASAGMFGQTYAQAVAATKQMRSVSDAAKKASTTLGIDELNVVSQDKDDTGKADLSALDTAKYEDASNFGQRVTDMLSGLASKIGPGIAKIAAKIASSAPAVVSAGVQVIKSLLGGLNANAPAIMASGMSILQTLLEGASSILPEIGPLVVNVITFLATAFLTAVPQLLSMGVTLLTNILTGLAETIPTLIPLAIEAVATICKSITDNLPTIISAGISILLSLISGISEMLPTLIPAAVDCILILIQGLVDSIPMLIDTAVDLVVSLVEGIVASLPILLAKAPEIIITLIAGITSAIPKLIGAIPKIITAIIDTLMGTDWLQVGKDILAGIGNGLVKGVTGIWDSVKEAGANIVDGFKSFFGIHSPSRLMRDKIGKQMAAGIGVGFEDEMDRVNSAMQSALPSSFDLPAPELANVGTSRQPSAGSGGYVSSQSDSRSYNELIRILSSIDSRLVRLLEWAEQLDLNIRLFIGDREIYNAAERGRKGSGAVIVRV